MDFDKLLAISLEFQFPLVALHTETHTHKSWEGTAVTHLVRDFMQQDGKRCEDADLKREKKVSCFWAVVELDTLLPSTVVWKVAQEACGKTSDRDCTVASMSILWFLQQETGPAATPQFFRPFQSVSLKGELKAQTHRLHYVFPTY